MAKINDKTKITRFVERGQFSENVKTVGDLIKEAGELLDVSESQEIIGHCILFRCSDGKWYTASVEVCVTEAHPEFVKSSLRHNKWKKSLKRS